MAQIPLFNQSQRLEPGNPVAAISPEGSAGALEGRNASAFGGAMFALGNTLDVAAKQTKNAEDPYEAKILIGQYNQKAQEIERELKKSAINLKDNPNGNDAVRRYTEATGAVLSEVLASASSDKVRLMIQAGMADDLNAGSARVAVDYFDRREKHLKLMRQDDLNALSYASRTDSRMLPITLESWRESVLKDDAIADSDKPAMIAQGMKAISEENIWGIVEQAKQGDPFNSDASFKKAHEVLETKMAQIFTQEEKLKIANKIDSERNEYFSFINTMNSAFEKTTAIEAKQLEDKATLKYGKLIQQAGADTAAIQAVIKQIKNDPDLSYSRKGQIVSEAMNENTINDELYEAQFNEDLYLRKFANTEALLNKLDEDAARGKVSWKKWPELQRKVRELDDEDKKNPGLKSLESAAAAEIRAAWGADSFDFETKMYKGQVGREITQALTFYASQISNLHANKNYSEAGILAARNATLMKFHKYTPDYSKNTQGLGALKDKDATIKTLGSLYRDKALNGDNWGPKLWDSKINEINEANNALQFYLGQEMIKKSTPTSAPSQPQRKAVGD